LGARCRAFASWPTNIVRVRTLPDSTTATIYSPQYICKTDRFPHVQVRVLLKALPQWPALRSISQTTVPKLFGYCHHHHHLLFPEHTGGFIMTEMVQKEARVLVLAKKSGRGTLRAVKQRTLFVWCSFALPS
jgi:hypothetical protein